jgi:hypothetical protein
MRHGRWGCVASERKAEDLSFDALRPFWSACSGKSPSFPIIAVPDAGCSSRHASVLYPGIDGEGLRLGNILTLARA